MIVVHRHVKFTRDSEPNVIGPIAAGQALKDGWFSSSSGTVSVHATDVATGRNVSADGGLIWRLDPEPWEELAREYDLQREASEPPSSHESVTDRSERTAARYTREDGSRR